MKRRYLPPLRRGTQFVFFLLALFVFEGSNPDSFLLPLFHALHLLPPLADWWSGGLTAWAVVTALLLLSTLIVGRLYCGWLCPVGLWQDLAARLGRRLGIRPRPTPRLLSWRVLLCLFTIASLLAGVPLVAFLDHYSQLGSALRGFVLPGLGGLARLLDLDILRYTHLVEQRFLADPAALVSLGFFLILFLTSLVYPRFWCNLFCPSGTVFVLLQRLSLLEPAPRDGCPVCRVCDRQCSVLCLDAGRVDALRCTACLECLEFCPSASFGLRRRRRELPTLLPEDPDRRRILRAAAGGVAGLLAAWGGKRWFRAQAVADVPRVVPPGAGSRDHYFARCLACGLCAAVCPTGVLRPLGGEEGPALLFRPVLDLSAAYCSYECNACGQVCPAGAIRPLPLAEKKRVKIGLARLAKGICIAWRNGKDCGACAEVCPTQAVHMVKRGRVFVPKMSNPLCTGCGHCQLVCPVSPVKAIRVQALRQHRRAAMPKTDAPATPFLPYDNQFPF